MSPASLPRNESERVAALQSYEVLDTQAEEAFDQIVRLAAHLTGSPIALVSLVDSDRQWFKARYGLDVAETPREHAFCAHAILDPDRPLCVSDATVDSRFESNPLVTGAPDIRAYLGFPLVTPNGHALGTLCVIDRTPRSYTHDEIESVSTLSRAVMTNLELRRALRCAQELALIDALTGLPNRRAAVPRLSEAIARGSVTVVAVDLDHFKEANDAQGHAAGDALLRAAAAQLRSSVREDDVVVRLGGDEFAVFLSGVGDRRTAEEITTRIRAALHQPVLFGGKLLRLSATLGVAIAPLDADEPEMVLRAADDALMQAKREGRGGVRWASRADAERIVRAAVIVRAFDAACDSEGLEVRGATAALQPIVALGEVAGDASGAGASILALEALARWSDPLVGEVPPGELFPLLGPVRAAMLGRTCRTAALSAIASLRADGLTRARVALNLSAAEVAQPDIAEEVAAAVEAAGLSLDAIEVEITEEVLLERVSDRALNGLAALRGRGARLVLDDFGTGNSGLSQLLRLPLDAVKLDKRFVQRLGADARATEIVRATVSLARGLGLSVVAEGIETERQAALAAALGCDAAQCPSSNFLNRVNPL